MKRFRTPAGSLARRFALTAATLAGSAVLLTALASFWLANRQHENATQMLQRQELNYSAANVSSTLYSISDHMNTVATNDLLTSGLLDSVGKEVYLRPFLASIRQIDGVPIKIVLTDFEGKLISDNGIAGFNADEQLWLRKQLQLGASGARIMDSAHGPKLVVAQILRYSQTRSPEGALLYKISVNDLRGGQNTRIVWGDGLAETPTAATSIPINAPENFRHLGFRLISTPDHPGAPSLKPQYLIIILIAGAMAGIVLIIGSRLSVSLTKDLSQLEKFATGLVQDGIGLKRAQFSGSTEIVNLANAINHMLDRLNQQHSQLKNESEKLRQLVNTIPQLAWMADPNGYIHWYNDRWYSYTGTTPRDMRGWGWRRVHEPRTLRSVFRMWRASIASGQPFVCTSSLKGGDGTYHTFFTRAAPLRDENGCIVQWFGTSTDVSPLEEAERNARESEQRLHEGLSAARMVVWDWDIKSNELKMSLNTSRLFGSTFTSTLDAMEWIHPEDAEKLNSIIERAIRERSNFDIVVRMRLPSPEQMLWVDMRGKVICDADGTPCTIRGISLDITKRKLAEDALRRADRRKDEFLAMLAHELRNPLAPIRTAAEVLRQIKIDEPRVRLTSEIITRQISHMTGLIDDLLDVSRVTRGLVKLDRRPLDLRQVVANAVEQARALIESRHQRLALMLPPEPLFVLGDQTRLIQVVTNLLNNAAKYTPAYGHIELEAQKGKAWARLMIRDDGIGIPNELLPHIFELFTQAERTPDRSQGGLGLGLALVKSLLELHGGTISASSGGHGRGSEFVARLPLLQHPIPEVLEPVAKHPQAEFSDALSILIVDDNADAANSLAMLLEAEHHQVMVEYAATGALRRAATQAPSICLLDIGLPDIDGYALARKLRDLPQTSNAILVALTGYGQAQDQQQSYAAGFDYHFVKPVDPERLLALISQSRQHLQQLRPPAEDG